MFFIFCLSICYSRPCLIWIFDEKSIDSWSEEWGIDSCELRWFESNWINVGKLSAIPHEPLNLENPIENLIRKPPPSISAVQRSKIRGNMKKCNLIRFWKWTRFNHQISWFFCRPLPPEKKNKINAVLAFRGFHEFTAKIPRSTKSGKNWMKRKHSPQPTGVNQRRFYA